jgi:transposase
MPISPELQDQIEKLTAEGLSSRAIARELGIGKTAVLKYRRYRCDPNAESKNTPPKENIGRSDDVKRDQWEISLDRTRIHTLDDLLEYCEVDTETWDVERFLCNKWEVGIKKGEGDAAHVEVEPLYQVKVWLKKKALPVLAIQEALAQFKEEAKNHSPKFPPTILRMRSKYSSGVWVEHSIVDHHFGALIWDKETGRGDYDLNIAKTCWRGAIIANCDRTDSYKPEGILFPIGNDQQNADNRQGNTEKGTPQSMDSRYQKVTRVSRAETKWAVDQFLARYGRVHVVPVPGNHDPLTTFHLGDYLDAWYRNDPRVTVDTRPLFRKYWELGVVGIGFLHGNTGKLERYGMTFAAEEPKMWGRTRWREIHSADKHQRSLVEFDGYAVRILPSLRPPCDWSSENMLGAVRASESYVWSKTEGLIGNATFSVLPKPKRGQG